MLLHLSWLLQAFWTATRVPIAQERVFPETWAPGVVPGSPLITGLGSPLHPDDIRHSNSASRTHPMIQLFICLHEYPKQERFRWLSPKSRSRWRGERGSDKQFALSESC
jgi:hypothetical protein